MPQNTSFRNNGSNTNTSSPFTLNGQNYNVKIESNVENGDVKASSIKLQKEVTTRGGKDYVAYAESFDGGKTWYEPDSKPPKKVSTSTGLSEQEIAGLGANGDLRRQIISSTEATIRKNDANDKQVLQMKNGNVSNTPGNGEGTTTEPTEPTATERAAGEDIGTTFGGTRATFGNLYYPETLAREKQDVICFEMLKYEPREFDQTTETLNPIGNRPKQRSIIGSVILPIPAGISDRNSVNWGGANLPVLEAMAATIANAGVTQGLGAAAKEGGDTIGAVSSNSTDAGGLLANRFVSAAAGTSASDLLSRTRGVVENPNMELLFQGPTLRPFSFQFKLTPRSSPEAAKIVKIIRFFKQGMAPQRTQSQLFLRAPHTFQLTYKHINEKHKFLNYFKECALTSFSVNYTPEGQYATYTDGSMVSYEISMEFTELEPVYNDEYSNIDQNADTHIGY